MFVVPEHAEFRSLIKRVRDRDEEAARELAMKYESAIRRVVRIHLQTSESLRASSLYGAVSLVPVLGRAAPPP